MFSKKEKQNYMNMAHFQKCEGALYCAHTYVCMCVCVSMCKNLGVFRPCQMPSSQSAFNSHHEAS